MWLPVPGYYFDHRALGRGTMRGSARRDFREHRPAPSQAPHIGLASAFLVNPDLVPNTDPGFL
jgi:hypothetical protein